MLIYGFRLKKWRGYDLEARFRELLNVYLTLYALQRSKTGTFLEREEEKAMKRRREVHKEVLIGSEDDLLRLGYESSALTLKILLYETLWKRRLRGSLLLSLRRGRQSC